MHLYCFQTQHPKFLNSFLTQSSNNFYHYKNTAFLCTFVEKNHFFVKKTSTGSNNSNFYTNFSYKVRQINNIFGILYLLFTIATHKISEYLKLMDLITQSSSIQDNHQNGLYYKYFHLVLGYNSHCQN